MSNNLSIFFLILVLSFICTFEDDNLESFSKLVIKRAYGDLKELQNQETITLSFVFSLKLNPKNLTNLVLSKDGKDYKPETKCFETEKRSDQTLVKCKLDLSELSHGTYKITSFTYKKRVYYSRAIIKILKYKKIISDIKLINFEASKIIEYKHESLKLLFDREFDYRNINHIQIQSESRKKFKLKAKCSTYENKLYCGADFFVKCGKYKLVYVSNGEEIITSDKEFFFDIQEDIVHLTKAYNYYGADITNSRHNSIRFFFDQNIEEDYGYFTKFSFTNVETGKTYDSYDFRRLYGSTGRSDQDDYIFDFHKFPPGEYYINYVYKLRSYHSKIKIRIEPVKKVDLSRIYQDRDL